MSGEKYMVNKNNKGCTLIDCQYKNSQGGEEMQDKECAVSKSITPEMLLLIREALADGIARTLVYTAITELHKND